MADETNDPKLAKAGSAQPTKMPKPNEAIPGVVLPPLPKTGSPVEFSQQINVYQIPGNAWDRLTQEQTMELTRMILERADAVDKRHFEYAMEKARQARSGKKLAMILGTLVTVSGYGCAAWLGLEGHEAASLAIALPITTILAMIIGNRFLD